MWDGRPKHVDSKRAAQFLGKSTKTLKSWRRDGKGPPYFPESRTVVLYRIEDLERYVAELEGRRRDPRGSNGAA